jgi:hypothetical protein
VVTLSPGKDATPPDVKGFFAAEEKILGQLAAVDSRFARRMGRPPPEELVHAAIVQALAAGDADLAVVDDALDPFSFTARARGLDAAKDVLSKAPRPETDIPVGGVPVARPKLERELLERLVAEEAARLDEERALPRGAGALLRGIAEAWQPPETPAAAQERDKWLAGRLDLVRGSLATGTLSAAGLQDLDAVLDPLERIADSAALTKTLGATAQLRVAIGKAAPAQGDAARWANVQAALLAHLGLSLGAADLRARLDDAERTLRVAAKDAVAKADERAVAFYSEKLSFAVGTCTEGARVESPHPEGSPVGSSLAGGSRVRALAPPPEREFICGARHPLHDAKHEVARAAALVALHDEAVVALWSLDANGAPSDAATQTSTAKGAHPYFGAQPVREMNLRRIAESRPVAAVGVGLAAAMVIQEGVLERWLAFGDAPLDIVEREVVGACGVVLVADADAGAG